MSTQACTSGTSAIDMLVNLSTALRQRLGPSKLLSHAPQTPYLYVPPNLSSNSIRYYGSYQVILALTPTGVIDFLNVQSYNQKDDSLGQECVNNVLQWADWTSGPKPLPQPLPSALTLPSLPSTFFVLGQIPGEPSKNPMITPWCEDTPRGLPSPLSLMFWLQGAALDLKEANAAVKSWTRVKPVSTVVYYLGDVPTGDLATCGANILVLGFAYTGFPSTGIPEWAGFGMKYAFGIAGEAPSKIDPVFAGRVQAWLKADSSRKVMIGIGGAADPPPYTKWAEGDNVNTVAIGLHAFMKDFENTNGFPLAGVDIDYEDSEALARANMALGPHCVSPPSSSNHQSPSSSGPSGSVPDPTPGPPSALVPWYKTKGFVIGSICAAVLLVLIIIIATTASKKASRPTPTFTSSAYTSFRG